MSRIYRYHPPYHTGPVGTIRDSGPCYNSFVEDPLDPILQHKKDLERIQNFRLIDDDFMSAVFIMSRCSGQMPAPEHCVPDIIAVSLMQM